MRPNIWVIFPIFKITTPDFFTPLKKGQRAIIMKDDLYECRICFLHFKGWLFHVETPLLLLSASQSSYVVYKYADKNKQIPFLPPFRRLTA
jgi:hypothetical protein